MTDGDLIVGVIIVGALLFEGVRVVIAIWKM
jgi:hypothetical protein